MSEKHATVIRAAGAEDAELLGQLNRFVHDAHLEARPDYFRAAGEEERIAWFRTTLEEPDTRVWIGELDGRPVGYASARLFERPRDALRNARRYYELDHVAVDPAFRRRGIGRSLVEAAFDAASTAGVAELELTTWSFNRGAHEFFEACGFRPKTVRLSRPCKSVPPP